MTSMSSLDDRIRDQRHVSDVLARNGGKGVIAVDFDDTLTAPGGVEALIELRRRGYGLVILTSNADHDGIRSWLRDRWPDDDLPYVTDVKPQAMAYVDDKAVCFTKWDDVLDRFS